MYNTAFIPTCSDFSREYCYRKGILERLHTGDMANNFNQIINVQIHNDILASHAAYMVLLPHS